MISVIMPYWKRPDATYKALALYAKHYSDLDMEVILVDDGSHDFTHPGYPWLNVVQLPKKELPKNPCVPINKGVQYASGDVLVITNPEILHESPVLPQMLEQLRAMGDNGYVLAATWYDRDGRWHCHSHITADGYHESTKQPKGSGYHFCAMLNRSLWDRAGGFDEEYREGEGYDDPDFVWRVHRAGGQFLIRDDLVVVHTRDGASTNWPAGGLDRNKAMFMRKWPS